MEFEVNNNFIRIPVHSISMLHKVEMNKKENCMFAAMHSDADKCKRGVLRQRPREDQTIKEAHLAARE